MNETWTCEFCAKGYLTPHEYTNCQCAGRQAFNAGGEYESAVAEARERGMAFIVDGKHVNADRVFILSVPDTVGPISDMRRAKADAERTIRDLEAFSKSLPHQCTSPQGGFACKGCTCGAPRKGFD